MNHHPLGPSNHNAWALCPRYESTPVDPEDTEHPANKGTRIHEAAESILQGDSKVDCEEGEWYAGEIQKLMKAGVEQFSAEYTLQLFDDSFEEVYFGTADCVWIDGNTVCVGDLKTGRVYVDARPQIMAYAVAAMQRFGLTKGRGYACWSKLRQVDEWEFTYEEALAEVMQTIKREGPATPCQYCEYCAISDRCPALSKVAELVANGYNDEPYALSTWHSSEITKPEEMSQALEICDLLEGWIKSVKFHASEMMIKGGLDIPGRKIQKRAGSAKIRDLNEAYGLLGLEPDQFIRACTASIPKLAEVYAETKDLKKAAATKEVKKILEPITDYGAESVFLAKEKGNKE